MEHDRGVLTKRDLAAQGFRGFTTIRELRRDIPRSEELNRRGVYAVVCSPTYTPTFIDPDKARRNRNLIKPWSLEKLEKKWVSGVEVLYFGKAGTDMNRRTLRKRLSELIRHSQGKTTNQGPHRGGELLWQLKGYESFEVGYLPTDQPGKEESSFLSLFLSETGKLPFAKRIPRTRQTRSP